VDKENLAPEWSNYNVASRLKGGRMKGGVISNGYSPTPMAREETSARPLRSSE
jgi:hypothetical protein